jgi:hypothetical protein
MAEPSHSIIAVRVVFAVVALGVSSGLSFLRLAANFAILR